MLETSLAQTALAGREEAAGLNPDNFDAIVRQNQRRIFRVLLLCLRDADAADTLTQECFLRAFKTRARFRGECSLQTWLVRIAVNLAQDHAKSRRRLFWSRLVRDENILTRGHHDPHPSPEGALLVSEAVNAIWSMVEDLSHQQRSVFVLRYAEEMALEEISAVLDLKLGSVKSHLSRALATLRRRLQGEIL
ncbi:MAG TPA: RNA polymerase sigma factor [Acidobacteriota bacterium]|nr:RNA polymerase sigma factor [Acidobacteriota bacterium]